MDVRLPDGTVVRGVPDSTTRDQLAQKLQGNGMNVPQEWLTKPEAPKSTIKEDVVGELESAGHILSGSVGALAGGVNYMASLAAGRGTEDALRRKEATERGLTYEPRTQAGKEITANLERPFQKLSELGEKAGSKVSQATGSPALGSATRTAIEGAPAFIPGVPKVLRRGAEAIGPELASRVRPVAERIATAGEEKAAVRAAEEAPKQAKITQARSIGLKLPPSEAGGAVGKALEGVSGKVQTEMALSRENAKVINRTAGKEIGLSDRQPLTEANVERQKKKAFQAYDAVRRAGKVTFDDQYRQQLNAVRERTQQAEEDFPEDTNELIDKEIRKFDRPEADAGSMLEKVKSLRDRASRNMKSPDAEKFELGLAQKKIATAMEEQIDRQVSATQPDLINNFRAARVQLAKIYNVEDALGPNGNLSAAVLARQLKRGVPLSGGLRTVAETYQEFPKVMRYTDNLGGHAPFSALDYLVGGVEAAANPASAAKVVGALAGRPVARGIIKSEAYQRAAIKPREVRPSVVSRAARQLAGPPQTRVNTIGDSDKPLEFTPSRPSSGLTLAQSPGAGGPYTTQSSRVGDIPFADVLSTGVEKPTEPGLSLAPDQAPVNDGIPFRRNTDFEAGDLELEKTPASRKKSHSTKDVPEIMSYPKGRRKKHKPLELERP